MPIEKESPEEMDYDKIKFNLAESSVTDLKFDELDLPLHNLKLEYVPHRGNKSFRQSLISGIPGMHEDQVLVTNGAAAALFIINTALLSQKDHLIVIRPNYSSNIEVPRSIGCAISFIDLKFEEGWRVNITAIEAAITPATKLISITTPHNPTGMVMTETELVQLAQIAEKNGAFLLVDETYRDACFKTAYPIMASLGRRIITVSSLSKTFGLPGLRIGWIITQDEDLMEIFLAAKEMIYISNSAIDEEIASRFYVQKEKFAAVINAQANQKFGLFSDWLQQESRLECILPQGGVVAFPRFKEPSGIDTGRFYSLLMERYGTMVGPGHWFEMPDAYMRIGFGWPAKEIFEQGLEHVSKAMSDAAK